jgi:alpha-tubulin suppressor-like RCC1 family protein
MAIVTTDGRCFVFGNNHHGQLGLGHTKVVSAFTELTLPSNHNHDNNVDTAANRNHDSIAAMALGSAFGAIVSRNGDLYTAGSGGMGMLGHGDASSRLRATRVESLVRDDCTVQQAVAGDAHLTVLTTEGEVLTAGAGSFGRLGNYETLDQLYLEPVEVLTPETNIVSLASGESFTIALSKDGVVYVWGRNDKGQLGTGPSLHGWKSSTNSMSNMQVVPERIATSEMSTRHIVAISAGHSHAAAISDQGELFLWGMGLYMDPVQVEDLRHTRIVAVSCGYDYTLAIDVDGNLHSLGVSQTGLLGVRRLNPPVLLEALETQGSNGRRRVVQVSVGRRFASCIVEETL